MFQLATSIQSYAFPLSSTPESWMLIKTTIFTAGWDNENDEELEQKTLVQPSLINATIIMLVFVIPVPRAGHLNY